MGCVQPKNPRRVAAIRDTEGGQGGNLVIYRRDARNRSLEDFTEQRPRTGQRAGRRPERAPAPIAAPALKAVSPALAAAAAVK